MIMLIGMGAGSPEGMTIQGRSALQKAECIIGAKRLLTHLPDDCSPNRYPLYKPTDILNCIAEHPDAETVILRCFSAFANASRVWNFCPRPSRNFQRSTAFCRHRTPLAGLGTRLSAWLCL